MSVVSLAAGLAALGLLLGTARRGLDVAAQRGFWPVAGARGPAVDLLMDVWVPVPGTGRPVPLACAVTLGLFAVSGAAFHWWLLVPARRRAATGAR